MSHFDRLVPQQRGPEGGSPLIAGPIIARYRDVLSGCTFVVATPAGQPQLWETYLRGAEVSYSRHGVESVLEYHVIADGRSTALFFAALDPAGAVVGGMRVQGPYSLAVQAHAICEWDDREGSTELHEEITVRLEDGVIEMKTGWVDDMASNRRELTDALARIFVHSLRLMGVRWALGTVAQHAIRRWQTTGGVVSEGVAPVAYPDERYRTVLMWWDSRSFAELAVPEQLPLIMNESAQLRTVAPLGFDDIERASC
ncbi:hypothetical protein [Nakamurella sp. PAMC28650]|uniref:hypothetical protein n=1 Tax=Nakamurella sp. PAMC28650 TaxID=2762325 RepID=UPI00164D12F6|nr:hypothetical protein [Nakamurella sp. PAMC28650]QNK82066.1 hypothetical protein H7F38_04630 [Nakamurella sp. PAMC28650]